MQNRIIVAVGPKGSGKTSSSSIILKANDGAFVFDPHCDEAYRWMRNTAKSVGELEDFSRWRREAKPESRAALRYIPDGRLDPYESGNDFCAWAWTWRNAWICIEEVSECCRGVSAQGMPPELRRLVNQGRHRGLNQIYTGLRYAEIPRPISAGADVQLLARSQEPLDLDSMRVRIGSEATECVRGLGQHEFLVFFPDRSFQVIGSRDTGIAELVLRDTAEDVHADANQES